MIGAIAAHYVAATPPAGSYFDAVMADAPLAYWRLGEGSGKTLVDSSGNGKNGTYSGTLTWVPGLIPGSSDKCVDFTGNTWADTPTFTGALDPDYMSVDAVISLDAVGKAQTIHARANEANVQRSFRFLVNASNKLEFRVWIGAVQYVCTGSTPLTVGTTYHVAGTYDGATIKVYVNGALDGSLAQAGTVSKYGSGLAGLLGASYSGGLYALFDGKIDEVAYYGTALPAARIAAHAAAVVG